MEFGNRGFNLSPEGQKFDIFTTQDDSPPEILEPPVNNLDNLLKRSPSTYHSLILSNRIIGCVLKSSIPISLVGGLAVDSILGEVHRVHDDIDLLIDESNINTVFETISSIGKIRDVIELHRSITRLIIATDTNTTTIDIFKYVDGDEKFLYLNRDHVLVIDNSDSQVHKLCGIKTLVSPSIVKSLKSLDHRKKGEFDLKLLQMHYICSKNTG